MAGSGPASPPASGASGFYSSAQSFFWVDEDREGDRGSSGVDLVAVHVRQSEVQRSQGDRAPQLHQVPIVRLVLHDVAHALVDDHLADYVVAPRMWAALPSSLDRRYTSL